jgi:hypothetical protein
MPEAIPEETTMVVAAKGRGAIEVLLLVVVVDVTMVAGSGINTDIQKIWNMDLQQERSIDWLWKICLQE